MRECARESMGRVELERAKGPALNVSSTKPADRKETV
jgi:hypothetical protein